MTESDGLLTCTDGQLRVNLNLLPTYSKLELGVYPYRGDSSVQERPEMQLTIHTNLGLLKGGKP